MNTAKIWNEYRALNLQINGQLRSAGVLNHKGQVVKPLNTLPDSEWKTWIQDLMAIRDAKEAQI